MQLESLGTVCPGQLCDAICERQVIIEVSAEGFLQEPNRVELCEPSGEKLRSLCGRTYTFACRHSGAKR